MILMSQKQEASHYTLKLKDFAPQAILPTAGLDKIFNYDKVSIAIPLAIILAIVVEVVLNRTRFGYELRRAPSTACTARA